MSDDDLPDNVLFRWYAAHIGEPETETDVYLGFGLFFAGVVAAALGLALVLLAVAVHEFGTDSFYAVTRPAGALMLLSLPLAMTGVVVLLPVQARVTAAAGAGVVVAVVATAGFWVAYPGVLFGDQQNVAVVLGYAAGITLVVAATGASLIAHQLQRAEAPAPSEIRAAEDEPEETVSAEQVRADIEDAMQGVELSWGGIVKEEHRRLELSSDYADEYAGDIDVEATTTTSDGGVDEQVNQLKALKGGQQQTASTPSTVDDQTAALRELRQQKERDEVPANAPVAHRGLLGRLLDRLGLN